LGAAGQLSATPDEPDGIYRLGESVGWSIAQPADASPQQYHYAVKKNDFETIKSGDLEFVSGVARIETRVDEPSMIYVEITSSDKTQKPMALGAAVAPERLRPSVPEPADFAGFWRSKLQLLAKVPMQPRSTTGASDKDDVDYATITLNGINGTHIHGQLARPRRPGKFPGLVIYQWASPPYPLQKPWVTDRAAEGWLAFNIEPHDVLPDQPQAYYDALPATLKNYQVIGRDDRDKNYFLQMYLADYRAIEYLAGRPDWDHKTLVVMGTSMGGQQSICAASLDPRVSAVIVDEPAGADSNGELHGRAAGYPNWPADDPQIMRTALYFDTVNCAAHVTASALVAMGFVDTTAPPVGIWTAFNQLRGPKRAVPLVDSPHNHLATPEQQQPYTQASAQWLNTLLKGGQLFPRADRPYPRLDENSRIAHRRLLAKKKQGRIDAYFLGDSITRRWDAADPQYQDLRANWQRNFFGWNAADFGWGGDTTQNVIWRLMHGELDDVNPKLIVLLIGTNNVGRSAPLGDESERAAAVSAGIREILRLCRQKAPAAQIVLMGILPRNDNPAVMPIINRINGSIAGFADNHHIRYLNINDQLADDHGRLFEGMSAADHLHLTAKAYQVWADALKPIMFEVLGAPTAVDAAPPPSADPSTEGH
jgi:cephalosporin-C deacetylase-like acetyl esterase/lysophospholipase L1-like esterase